MSSVSKAGIYPRLFTFLALPRRERRRRFLALLNQHFPEAPKFAGVPLATIGDKLLGYRELWVRDPWDWHPSPRCDERANFIRFLRFVIERYRPPLPFVRTLTNPRLRSTLAFDWYLHLAVGRSIRSAHGLPFPLSKAAAHLVPIAPDDLSARAALTWAKLRALGLDDLQIIEMLGHQIFDPNRAVAHDAFWDGVALKIGTARVQAEAIPQLLDFITLRRRRDPSFQMGKRSIAKLLQESDQWAREAGQRVAEARAERKARGWTNRPKAYWPPCKSIASHTAPHPDGGEWKIIELSSAAELTIEGNRMKHCVADYTIHCVNGICSIWSLAHFRESGRRLSIATIDVQPRSRKVLDVCARLNQMPPEDANEVIRQWMKTNQLERGPGL